jgi:hypothetical protein
MARPQRADELLCPLKCMVATAACSPVGVSATLVSARVLSSFVGGFNCGDGHRTAGLVRAHHLRRMAQRGLKLLRDPFFGGLKDDLLTPLAESLEHVCRNIVEQRSAHDSADA